MLKIKYLIISLFMAISIQVSAVSAANITWVDWDSSYKSGLTAGSASGMMNFDNSSVDVSLIGMLYKVEQGTSVYDNCLTRPSNTYGDLNPFDIVRENGEGIVTISFSKAIKNPYIAMYSVGRPNYPVTYEFLNASTISLISAGNNHYGQDLTPVITGNSITGSQFHGIIQLEGSFDTLAINISGREPSCSHGFNIGAETPAPEPTTMLLGMLGLAGAARLRKKD